MAEKRQDMLCEKNEFMKHNHIRVTKIEDNFAATELTAASCSLNPYGIIHGGALFSMMDIAAGVAARTDGRDYVTLDSSLQFCKAASEGTLYAEGKVTHRGGTICTVETQVTDAAGALLSKGLFTMYHVVRKETP